MSSTLNIGLEASVENEKTPVPVNIKTNVPRRFQENHELTPEQRAELKAFIKEEEEQDDFEAKWTNGFGVCLRHICTAQLIQVIHYHHANEAEQFLTCLDAFEASRIYSLYGETPGLGDGHRLYNQLRDLWEAEPEEWTEAKLFKRVQAFYNVVYKKLRIFVFEGCGKIIFEGAKSADHTSEIAIYISTVDRDWARWFGVKNIDELIHFE